MESHIIVQKHNIKIFPIIFVYQQRIKLRIVSQQQNNSFSKYKQIESFFVFNLSLFLSKLLLGKSESFEDFGTPQLFPALSLLGAWFIVGACIIRGVKSSGKVRFHLYIFSLNMFNKLNRSPILQLFSLMLFFLYLLFKVQD